MSRLALLAVIGVLVVLVGLVVFFAWLASVVVPLG